MSMAGDPIPARRMAGDPIPARRMAGDPIPARRMAGDPIEARALAFRWLVDRRGTAAEAWALMRRRLGFRTAGRVRPTFADVLDLATVLLVDDALFAAAVRRAVTPKPSANAVRRRVAA
jgi:hypothetical protein